MRLSDSDTLWPGHERKLYKRFCHSDRREESALFGSVECVSESRFLAYRFASARNDNAFAQLSARMEGETCPSDRGHCKGITESLQLKPILVIPTKEGSALLATR